jgi:hypothetical protein
VEVEAFRQRRRDSCLRGVASQFLCRYAGLTQREAAGVLQMCGAAVSHQLRKLAVDQNQARRSRRRLETVQQRLGGLRGRKH